MLAAICLLSAICHKISSIINILFYVTLSKAGLPTRQSEQLCQGSRPSGGPEGSRFTIYQQSAICKIADLFINSPCRWIHRKPEGNTCILFWSLELKKNVFLIVWSRLIFIYWNYILWHKIVLINFIWENARLLSDCHVHENIKKKRYLFLKSTHRKCHSGACRDLYADGGVK